MPKKINHLGQSEAGTPVDLDLTPPEGFLDAEDGEEQPALDPDDEGINYFAEPEEGDDEETAEEFPGVNEGEDDDDGELVQSLNDDSPDSVPGKPSNKASSPASRPRGRPRKEPQSGLEFTPKRGPGRPRKHLTPGEEDDGMRGITTFPKPAYFHMKDSIKEQKGKPAAFFSFWRQAWKDEELKQRIVVYVYRTWPVLIDGRRQIDKLNEPIRMEDLQLRYGAGDYHLKLNDMGNKYKTVAICTVTGMRDEAEYPPVFELDALDVKDPLNQGFLERLRSRGIRVPGDPGYVDPEESQKEDDMANVEMVRTVADAMERSTNRTIDIMKQQQQERAEMEKKIAQSTTPPAPTPEETERITASTTAMNIVASGVQMSQKILADAVNASRGIGADGKPVPATPAPDPIAMITQVANLINTLKPPENNGMAELVKELRQQQEKRIESLEALLLERNRASDVAVTTQEVLRPKSLLEQIKEMAAAKETMREVLGIEDGPASNGWVEALPTILQGLGVLGSVVVAGLHNLAVIKTGQGVPQAPPSPTQILTPEQQAAMRQAGFTVPNQPQPGPAQPQSQPQPQYGEPDMNLNPLARYHQVLAAMQTSLLRAYNSGIPGHEYAELLIELGDNGMFGADTTGRQMYDGLVEAGQLQIAALIKTFPPIWDVVGQTPKKWEKFLADFLNADEIFAQLQEQEDAANGQISMSDPAIIIPPIKG